PPLDRGRRGWVGRPAGGGVRAAARGRPARRALRAGGGAGRAACVRERGLVAPVSRQRGRGPIRQRGGRSRMIGLVLAAGAGRRLAPFTDALPKTLLTVDGERSILDVAIANIKHVGLDESAVVIGV